MKIIFTGTIAIVSVHGGGYHLGLQFHHCLLKSAQILIDFTVKSRGYTVEGFSSHIVQLNRRTSMYKMLEIKYGYCICNNY